MYFPVYSVWIFSGHSGRGKSLKYAYKRDKNAVLKLMSMRDDYEVIVIRKDMVDKWGGMITSAPFIVWDRGARTLTAYGKNNPYSRPADRDKFSSDITPWYITAGK